MTDTIQRTSDWFSTADAAVRENNPDNTVNLLTAQIGFHFEEIAETLVALNKMIPDGDIFHEKAITAIKKLSAEYVNGNYPTVIEVIRNDNQREENRLALIELLDGLGDTVVTSTGVINRCGVDPVKVMKAINDSNYSKFDENGKPFLKPNGKIGGKDNPRYHDPIWDDIV